MDKDLLPALLSAIENAERAADEDLDRAGAAAVESEPGALPGDLETEGETAPPNLDTDVRRYISTLTIPGKIKLALGGNAACRAVLILDPGRIIPLFVLKNARLTPREVEDFSKNTQLSHQVLRAISDNQKWVREYSIKRNLVFNPKSPADVSLKWLRYLQGADLKRVARSKNVPELVAVTARKRLSEME